MSDNKEKEIEEKILGSLLEEDKKEIQEIALLDRQLHYDLVKLIISERQIKERQDVIISQLRNILPQREKAFKEVITKRVGTDKWQIRSDGKIYLDSNKI